MLKGFGVFISQTTDQPLEKQPNICNGRLVTLCICSEFSGFQCLLFFLYFVCAGFCQKKEEGHPQNSNHR